MMNIFIDYSFLHTGFCDRLRALVFGVALARVCNEEVVYINDVINEECPYDLIDLVSFRGIAIKRDESVYPRTSVRMTPFNSLPSLKNSEKHNPFPERIPARVLYKSWLDAYSTILFPRTLFEHLPASIDVGVHIRSTDRISKKSGFFSMTHSELEEFLRVRLPLILTERLGHGCRTLFVACDDEYWFNCFMEAVPVGFDPISYDRSWGNIGRRRTNGLSLVTDIFGLSRCAVVYSNVGGGVFRSAELIAATDKRNFIETRRLSKRTIPRIYQAGYESLMRRFKDFFGSSILG